MARKKSLVIEILGNNKMGRAVRDAMGSLRRLGRFAAGVGRGIAKAFKWAAAGIGIAAGGIAYAVKKAFDFEAYRVQLKVLLGSVEAANEAFQTLAEFSARTPFQLSSIVEAYQQLQTFTEGALNTRDGLELVGDAAAARGKDFEEVAYWVGRLYSALKNGDPFMDAVGALQRLGVVGGTIRGDLTELTKTGVDFGAKWAVVTQQLIRFRGGMKDLSSTGRGLWSTVQDNWTLAVATFGDAFSELSKGAMTQVIDTLQRLREDGSITRWAETGARAVERVATALTGMFGDQEKRQAGIADLQKMFSDAGAVVKPYFIEWGEAAGAAIWRGFKSGTNKAGGAIYSSAQNDGSGTSTFRKWTSPLWAAGAGGGTYSAMRESGAGYLKSAISGFGAAGTEMKRIYGPGSSQGQPLYVQEVKPIDGLRGE